jgi:hypothetical protein
MPVEGQEGNFEFKPLSVKPKEEEARGESSVAGHRPLSVVKEMSRDEAAAADQLKETKAAREQAEVPERMQALEAEVKSLTERLEQLEKVVKVLKDQEKPEQNIAEAIVS